MTNPLWIRDDVLVALQPAESLGTDWQATGVSIDSRTVQAGDLFVALEGPNVDGHDYVEAALKAGAVAAVVHRPISGSTGNVVIVKDTFAALENLARAARFRLSQEARVCAVTGSVGKTGTKEMLVEVLSKQGRTAATQGNLNNHWGLPLSLARIPADCDYVVLELGMNHAGELSSLSAIARPHAAIITTVEAVHIEFFKSVADIADAKAEIFDGLEPDGVAIINADNEFCDRLFNAARRVGAATIRTFGTAKDADVQLLEWQPHESGATVTVSVVGQKLAYRLPQSGRHVAMNSASVLAITQAIGANVVKAAQALSEVKPPKGRGGREIVAWQGGTITLIDDSYNASPVAVEAALAALALVPVGSGGRRIAVLGDMLELGEQGPAYHAALSDACADAGVDLVFTAGPLMKNLFKAIPPEFRGGHAANSAELAPIVEGALQPGDVVMVKGSKGSLMGKVIDAIRTPGAHNQKIAFNGA